VGICLERGAARLFAHDSADATATTKPHQLLPHLNPGWFYFSGTGLPKLYRKEKMSLNGCSSNSSSSSSPRMRRFEPRAWDGLTDRRIAALLYASPYGQGYNTQVWVQLPTSAGNVSLLAFAAERRAAVRHVARRPAGGRLRRSISPAHGFRCSSGR